MKILVTAGPTREYLDPVRFISNPSTGKMGYAVARAAKSRGHRVTLVSGPTHLQPPAGVKVIPVVSAEEMLREVRRHFRWCDGVVMTAAVGDFRSRRPASQKIKKGKLKTLALNLVPTPDILAYLGERKGKKWLVGFAAETSRIEANARKKLKAKNLDMVVANDVRRRGAGFGADTNIVTVITRKNEKFHLAKRTKDNLGRWLLEKIERDFQRH